MATIDPAKKFAEQAVSVERVLHAAGIPGNAGRVILVLTMAKGFDGVSQKEVVARTALPKDQVSKLAGSLVEAGLLSQVREDTNSRIKRLSLTESGRDLLSRVKATLQPPRMASPKREPVQGFTLVE